MHTFYNFIDGVTPQLASSQARLTESAGAQATQRDRNNLNTFVFSNFGEL